MAMNTCKWHSLTNDRLTIKNNIRNRLKYFHRIRCMLKERVCGDKVD